MIRQIRISAGEAVHDLHRLPAVQDRMCLPVTDQLFCIGKQLCFLFQQLPVQPVDLIILTIGIVIPLHAASHFITCQ